MRELQYTFEEFLSVYQAIKYESLPPLKDQFMQVFKSYDRESQGVLTVAQIRHILGTYAFIDHILEETKESAFSDY
ncbi:hypothetical protein ACTXT7_008756 [Hymenolepis weldensis]